MKQICLLLLLLLVGACKSGYDRAPTVLSDQPDRPPCEYQTPFGVRVCAKRPPTEREARLIDAGILDQLSRSKIDQPQWTVPNAWRSWNDFNYPRDYKVWLIETPVRAESPDIAGCPIINTKAGTAAGTVAGVRFPNGKWSGDPTIIVPHLTDNRPECEMLFMKGVDHESEHVRLLNDVGLYMQYVGNEPDHPFFKVPVVETVQ